MSDRFAPAPNQVDVQRFYDTYWPANLPDARRTRDHILSLLASGERFALALDGGCGTGVCAVALAEAAETVVACDIAFRCAETAARQARAWGRENVRPVNGSLLDLPFGDGHFDLALSWGVIHHTADPLRSLDEIVRVVRPGGLVVIGVYEASQIEDWFFVPIKFFFTQAELREAFEARGLTFELVADRTARFRATSIFIARGRKR